MSAESVGVSSMPSLMNINQVTFCAQFCESQVSVSQCFIEVTSHYHKLIVVLALFHKLFQVLREVVSHPLGVMTLVS